MFVSSSYLERCFDSYTLTFLLHIFFDSTHAALSKFYFLFFFFRVYGKKKKSWTCVLFLKINDMLHIFSLSLSFFFFSFFLCHNCNYVNERLGHIRQLACIYYKKRGQLGGAMVLGKLSGRGVLQFGLQ